MKLISITIGRNIKDTPMTTEQWQNFKRQTDACLASVLDTGAYLLRDAFPSIVLQSETVEFIGQWDGNYEDSARITALVPAKYWNEERHNALVARLKIVRDDFKQDAIALAIADSELI